MSSCRVCGNALVSSENWSPSYVKNNNRICRVCNATRLKQYALDNAEREHARLKARRELTIEKRRADYRIWYAANAEIGRAASLRWTANNKERAAANKRAWSKANPEKTALYKATRKSRLLCQTNETADAAKIAEFYRMASRLTRITGKPYHVDHIEPLSKGGLHHQDNLVVMTGPLNSAKRDAHWPWLTWFNSPSD